MRKTKCEKPSQERVKELFDYIPHTGALRWKVCMGNRRRGDTAGSRKDGNYAVRIEGKKFLVRDLVWIWHNGKLPRSRLIPLDDNHANTAIENLAPMRTLRDMKVSFL